MYLQSKINMTVCKFCGANNVNKKTCPHNPDSKKPKVDEHNIYIEDTVKARLGCGYLLTEEQFDNICCYHLSNKRNKTNKCNHEKEVREKFNNDDNNFKKDILKHLNITNPNSKDYSMYVLTDFNKNKKLHHKLTDEFKEVKMKYGGDKRPNAKTDVIIENKSTDECYKISIKKGDGRLTSCKMPELAAFFKLILDKNIFKSPEVLKQKIDEILKRFPNENIIIGGEGKPNTIEVLKKTQADPKVNEYVEKTECLNKLFRDIIKYDKEHNDSKFINKLIYQLMTGEVKYGKDSIATADYYLQLTKDFKINNFMYIREDDTHELHEFYKKAIKCLEKKPFHFKSSCEKSDGTRTAWLRFL